VSATVAIVGRPNVGKSTLFNRLVGRRLAIVHDLPGVTRDRIVGDLDLENGTATLIDTGGLVLEDDILGLNEQVFAAIQESDLLLFVVDGREGLVGADEEITAKLRRFDRPTVVVVNKGDVKGSEERMNEFYSLGFGDVCLVSASHGNGTGDLAQLVEDLLPEAPPVLEVDAPKIAVVGRPNVGKSSITNRILGKERVLVSEIPGTTRDPIDSLFEFEDKNYLLIDTAGIRRRSKTSGVPEDLAIMMARRQLERADLALLLIDAEQGVTSGDLAIAGLVWELGRGAVVAVNKWDLLDGNEAARERLDLSWERLDMILSSPPRVNVSAETGRGVEKIFPAINKTLDAMQRQLSTGAVNRLFERYTSRHRPPNSHGRAWRMYYATQVSTGPPTFMIFANMTLPKSSSYRRYLENCVREELQLAGVPIRLVIRKRGKDIAEREALAGRKKNLPESPSK